jgi:hypothetical protein
LLPRSSMPLAKRLWLGLHKGRPRCGSCSIRADPGSFGPKRTSWGQPGERRSWSSRLATVRATFRAKRIPTNDAELLVVVQAVAGSSPVAHPHEGPANCCVLRVRIGDRERSSVQFRSKSSAYFRLACLPDAFGLELGAAPALGSVSGESACSRHSDYSGLGYPNPSLLPLGGRLQRPASGVSVGSCLQGVAAVVRGAKSRSGVAAAVCRWPSDC